MKIALLAPFEESVPPKKYGGTELVVHNLTEELVKRGHKVYLIAAGSSRTRAKLIIVFPKPIRAYPEAKNMKIRETLKFIGLGKALEYIRKIDADIVHNHLGWRLLPFANLIPTPIITTLHGPLDIDYQKFVYSQFKEYPFISISNNQRKPLPELNYLATVYNGINLKELEFNDNPEDYFAFLGRMSPEKGPIQAIEIAKKAGVKLKMAAKIDMVDVKYFKEQIEPLIDNRHIEYIGEIGPETKSEFLGKARGLLAPIQWQEPFGLFFVEAMACGTPVITFNRGSAPEIIKNNKTGFVVNNIEKAIKSVKTINKIKRKDCRNWVEENFTVEKMVDGYEKVYYQVLKL